MFHFRCPHCNAKLEAEDDWNGMETQCPKCSHTITIVPETTLEKPKIQLTPIPPLSSADTQRSISSQPLSQPAPSSTSSKFPFVCPSCGTLTDLDLSLQNQEYECPACCEKSIAVPATEKPCPHCGEMIKFQAKICRFCKKSLTENSIPLHQAYPQRQPYPQGQSIGAMQPFPRQSFQQNPPKSKTSYILLGLFLGGVGVHDFYAGYTTRGIIKLCITIVTLGYGGIISSIWALIDICTIRQDAFGQPMI